jgi:hypothetical protein
MSNLGFDHTQRERYRLKAERLHSNMRDDYYKKKNRDLYGKDRDFLKTWFWGVMGVVIVIIGSIVLVSVFTPR